MVEWIGRLFCLPENRYVNINFSNVSLDLKMEWRNIFRNIPKAEKNLE